MGKRRTRDLKAKVGWERCIIRGEARCTRLNSGGIHAGGSIEEITVL